MDYFECALEKLDKWSEIISVNKCEFILENHDYSFELFENRISQDVKTIYNKYNLLELSWESKINNDKGFVDLIPYSKIITEHEKLLSEIENIDEDIIEKQDKVINDIQHWYPVFLFPNGDKFCFDNRTGQIVFFEHDVFDSGINLHGLVIADSIDLLLINWSKLLFIDIYDWFEGVDDNGLDVNKEIFDFVRSL